MAENKIYIYGTHAVAEALQNFPEAVSEVFTDKNFNDEKIFGLVKARGIRMPRALPRDISDSAVHQGIVGAISAGRLTKPYDEFVKNLSITPDTSLVILDELEDPQNVGAIIRSAAAFGVSGVLIPERNQAHVTGAVIKVSAGMAFRVPLVSVGNVNVSVRDLKDRGFAIYGLAGGAKYTVTKEQFELPTVLIIGNESSGIREKTVELCDKLLSITIHPKCESLNAAASAAVALYSWSAKHPQALKI